MDAGSEWIFPSPSVPILPLLESIWDVPHMAAAVPHVVSRGTMTGATTGAMKEVMIVMKIVTMTESTVHTDADLRLLTTAEGIALGLGHGPTHHVTTEQ